MDFAQLSGLGTKQVGIWYERGQFDNYTAPKINPYAKRVLEFILSKMQSPNGKSSLNGGLQSTSHPQIPQFQ